MKSRHFLISLSILVAVSFSVAAQGPSVDPYMVVPKQSASSSQGMQWFDPMAQDANLLQGQGWPEELAGTYHRLPDRCEGVVRDPVWYLSKQSAGLSLVFHSDSPTIKVRYTLTEPVSMSHMPATGVSGVDLYSKDSKGKIRWCGADNLRSFKDTVSYTFNRLSYNEDGGYDFRLYLPPYNQVTWMEIGVEDGKSFHFIAPDKRSPVVVYGTSIAQGACASRPGMIWTNIIQREMGIPVVNLGFSGNAMMDIEVFELLSELKACLFIIDAMPNMDTANEKYIYQRTLDGVRMIRTKTSAPILLIAHEGYSNAESSNARTAAYDGCNIQLEKAFRTLVSEGVKNLHFLPHSSNALSIDDMVEGWHPNDLGMRHIATINEAAISKILYNK